MKIEKKNLHTYKEYVCPECFKQLPECKCPSLPWHLVQIDLGIQEQIRILNNKGYNTCFCCSGHYDPSSLVIYIKFGRPYLFDRFPEEFKYNKRNQTLSYTYTKKDKKTEEIYKERQAKLLADLLEWANELPSDPGFEY